MSKNITLPLAEYLDDLLGCKGYSVVDNTKAQRISNADPERTIAVVENTDLTAGFDGTPLPILANGLSRVWHRKDWELCDNRRRESLARLDASREAWEAKKLSVIDYLVVTGVGRELAQTIVAGMNSPTIEAMIAQIAK